MMKNPYMSLAVQTIASGIPVVILLRFDVRPHILGRQQLDRVPLRQEQAPKIATVQGAYFAANPTMLPGRIRRRSTTAPLSSSAATLQLILPKSMPIITMVMARPLSVSTGILRDVGELGRAIP